MKLIKNFAKGLLYSLLVAATSAHAGVIVTIDNAGPDVVVDYSGDIDVNSLSGLRFGNLPPSFVFINAFPGPSGFLNGDGFYDFHDANIIVENLGTNNNTIFPDTATGDVFGFGTGDIFLPANYIGGLLQGTMTFQGETLNSLGFNTGTYLYEFSNSNVTDFIQLNIGVTVPTPTTLALLGLGLAGLGYSRRRRTS